MLVVAFIGAFCLSGCIKDKNSAEVGTGYEVTDYKGRNVRFKKQPERIMTQSMMYDTMVLGLVPAEKLVSCHVLSTDPESSYISKEVAHIESKIYTFNSIPTEMVLKLKPDLIILPEAASVEMVNTFSDLGFAVLLCKSPRCIDDTMYDIRLIAKALKAEAAGEKVIDEMNRQLKEIDAVIEKQKGKKKPRGLLVSQMTSYGGKGSMFDYLCNRAGIINCLADVGLNNGELLTKELVIKSDPDFFMVTAMKKNDRYNNEKFKNEFIGDPAFAGMRALNSIHAALPKYLYTSSQNCVYEIKGIANIAYGDIFDMSDEHLIKGY